MTKTKNLYSNNARSTLSASITSSASTVLVTSVASFPTPGAGEQFYVTIDDGTNIEIILVTGVSGGSFTGCSRGQDGTTGHAYAPGAVISLRPIAQTMRELARIDDHMGDLPGITYLADPTTMQGNSYLCGGATAEGNGLIAVANPGGVWRFVHYPVVMGPYATGAGSTTTTVNFASATTVFPDTFAKSYIIQFTSGVNLGTCRYISAIGASTLTWVDALGVASGSTDTFDIYRYIGTNLRTEVNNLTTLKAPLASPALTGVPTAPTAAGGTNTTQIATTAFVTAVDVTKAPLASPALTGVPVAPTAASGTNTTQLATTAFVRNEFTSNQTLAFSGRQVLPGGLILQWTTLTLATGAATSYSWSTYGLPNFPSACYGIVANGDAHGIAVSSITTSSFTLDDVDSSSTQTIHLLAYGV